MKDTILRHPKVVFCTLGSPNYIPPLLLSDNQVSAGPNYQDIPDGAGGFRGIKTSAQFDVTELCARLPAHQQPELFVATVEGEMECVPRNVAQLTCRKVLIIADTHYGKMPLSQLITYCMQEKYDRYAIISDPHHLHWFTELGLSPLSLQLNLNVRDVELPFNPSRQQRIVFVGSNASFHPRRARILDALRTSGLPSFITKVGTSREAAALYAGSALTLNCSLNGDFNMRVFEALSAGACLLTDRLSQNSGLERLFTDGEHLILYDDVDDLLKKAKYYLEHPEECLDIARRGQARYKEFNSEQVRRESFLRFCFADDATAIAMSQPPLSVDARNKRPVLPSVTLLKRARVYEDIQELHRREMVRDVYCHDSIRRELREDLADLPQLKLSNERKNWKKSCMIIQDNACLKFLAGLKPPAPEFIYVIMGVEPQAPLESALAKLGYAVSTVWYQSKNLLFTLKPRPF